MHPNKYIFALKWPYFWHHRPGESGKKNRKKAFKSGESGRAPKYRTKGRSRYARNSWPENGSNAAKTSVRAPGLSTDEREHPFV